MVERRLRLKRWPDLHDSSAGAWIVRDIPGLVITWGHEGWRPGWMSVDRHAGHIQAGSWKGLRPLSQADQQRLMDLCASGRRQRGVRYYPTRSAALMDLQQAYDRLQSDASGTLGEVLA